MATSNSRFETEPIDLDDLGPERIVHVYDPRTKLRGIVVVDRTRMGMSGGGVRMEPDLTVREIARLARAMTLKNALCGAPTGGGKAGIWHDPSAPDRGEMVKRFLDAIRPITEVGLFMPGPDMGTTFADFDSLYARTNVLGELGHQEFEGLPLEDQLTGYGVVAAASAACSRLGRPLSECRVAIEGFGKVGAGAAKYFMREGARVVAVSNVHGALHSPSGLNVERLLALRARHGDEALERYEGGERSPREALFSLPCDVLVPGARPDSIHRGNVGALSAFLIVPAANIPYADGALPALEKRRIHALPDFVTNSGGVLGVLAGMGGLETRAIFDMVRDRIRENVDRMFDGARDGKTTLYDSALALARKAIFESE